MQQTNIVLYNILSLMIIYLTTLYFSRLLGIFLLILQFKYIIMNVLFDVATP